MSGRRALLVAAGMMASFVLVMPWLIKGIYTYSDWVMGIHHVAPY